MEDDQRIIILRILKLHIGGFGSQFYCSCASCLKTMAHAVGVLPTCDDMNTVWLWSEAVCLREDRTYESLVMTPSTFFVCLFFTLNVRPCLHSAWQLTGNWSHKYTKMLMIFIVTLKWVILNTKKKNLKFLYQKAKLYNLCYYRTVFNSQVKTKKFLAFICDCHFSLFLFCFLILLWLETYWSVGFHPGDVF